MHLPTSRLHDLVSDGEHLLWPLRFLVMGNGPEIVSVAVLRSAVDRGVRWHHIRPGKPAQNASTRTTSPRWQRPRASSPLGANAIRLIGRGRGGFLCSREQSGRTAG